MNYVFSPLVWILLIFIVMAFILVFFVFFKVSRKKKLGTKEVQYIKSHWMRIIDMFKSNPKAAILDADKLLDFVLGKHGFAGSLGEKLKKAGLRFSDLNGIWSAHKLRNTIAHELGDIDMEEAKRALRQFKQALNDLGAGL